jgi:hypothetical protein
MWIGIEQKQRREGPDHYPSPLMIGVVIRAGRGRQLGHFMYWSVSINGEKKWAGGAEDRIFPFHHVTLEHFETPPADMVPALGFCNDGNGYAFDYKGRPCIITKAAHCGMDEGFEPVPEERWPAKWEVK